MTPPTAPDLVDHWASEPWEADASAWIRQCLGEQVEIQRFRVRFWSSILTVRDPRRPEGGRPHWWFKENNPGQRFEAALSAYLAHVVPDRVISPVAVHADRGWILTADAGPVVRDVAPPTQAGWVEILQDYATLQRELVTRRDGCLATGLAAHPSSIAGEYLGAQVRALAALPASHPLHVEASQAEAWLAGLPRLREAAAVLEGSAIPDSLEHNDLHAGNCFRGADRRLRHFDFGDAVWAHPFGSLSCPMWAIAQGSDDVSARVVLDAYLEVWSDLAPQAELRHVALAALRVASTQRFETFRRLLAHVPAHHAEGWREFILYWVNQAVVPVEETLAASLGLSSKI